MKAFKDAIEFGLSQSNAVLAGNADNLDMAGAQIKNLQVDLAGLRGIADLKPALVRKLKRERACLEA